MDFIGNLLFLAVGFAAGFFWNKKPKQEKPIETETDFEEETELDPMTLRNGYGVTRCEKPTFAEQIINLANFSGENQKEENYE